MPSSFMLNISDMLELIGKDPTWSSRHMAQRRFSDMGGFLSLSYIIASMWKLLVQVIGMYNEFPSDKWNAEGGVVVHWSN